MTRIGRMTYRSWVRQEAIRIKSDKCTFARDWNVWCCYEHDLACHFGKDPRSAYRKWRAGASLEQAWLTADSMRRRQADLRFWKCNEQRSQTKWEKTRSKVRYIGVRIGAILPPY